MDNMDLDLDRHLRSMARLSDEIEEREEWMMWYKKKRASFPRWTMRTGETIRIEDMDDNHVRNTYAMLKRNDSDSGWREAMEAEIRFRTYRRELATLRKEYEEMHEVMSWL